MRLVFASVRDMNPYPHSFTVTRLKSRYGEEYVGNKAPGFHELRLGVLLRIFTPDT